MTEVQYFGYGANRDLRMMEAIIDRRPKGFPAKLEGYELCIQSWGHMPKKVRGILRPAWGPGFKSYCVRPADGKVVRGRVWILTKEERKILDDWELTDYWYHPVVIHFTQPSGKTTQIEVQIIDDQKIQKVIDGERYPTYLNDKEKMFKVARRVRAFSLRGRGAKKRLMEEK